MASLEGSSPGPTPASSHPRHWGRRRKATINHSLGGWLWVCICWGLCMGPTLVHASRSCFKTIGGRYEVDLSKLSSDRVTLNIHDPMHNELNYVVAVCGDHNIAGAECKVDDVVAVIENSCTYLGRFSAEGPYELLDSRNPQKGVKVTYGKGAKCVEPIKSENSVTFNMECDPTVLDPYSALVSVKSMGTCSYEFNFRTAYACPVALAGPSTEGSQGGGGWTFLVLIFIMISYCVGGSIYKANKYGASGVEVIPHIDLLRKASIQARDCLKAPMNYLYPQQVNPYTKHNPNGHFATEDVEVLEFSSNRRLSNSSSLMADDFEEDVKL